MYLNAGPDDPALRDVRMLTEASAFESCLPDKRASRNWCSFFVYLNAGPDDPALRDIRMMTEASAFESCLPDN
jgi:hypothetical protein